MDPFLTAACIKQAPDIEDRFSKYQHTKPLSNFERHTPEAIKVQGQLAHHADLVFSRQHRTHLFQLLVCGNTVRFIFWDHSGAIVSDLFDYVKCPLRLAQFFWRYNCMTKAERGWDLSAVSASSEERTQFTKAFGKFLAEMYDPSHPRHRIPQAEDTIDDRYPVMKITVEDDVSKEPVQVLVQAPFFRTRSAVGRATRGYIAYHLVRNELVFFKDSWREMRSFLTAERSIYTLLSDTNVSFILEVLSGGDVAANGVRGRTRCLEWMSKQSLDIRYGHRPKTYQHHRLLQPLAFPIQSAPNSKEYTRAFRDCIRGVLYDLSVIRY